MGLFEFLMILASVVIGLGVTEILTGWANLHPYPWTERQAFFQPVLRGRLRGSEGSGIR